MNRTPVKYSPLVRIPDSTRPALAGMMGGSAATLVLHPLELLKTRQAVLSNQTDQATINKYNSVRNAVRGIFKEEGGLRGLYRGVGANVALSGSSWGVYFLSYNYLKDRLSPNESCPPLRTHLAAAVGAGTLTTIITNPMTVVRTRMLLEAKNQEKNKYSTVAKTVRSIVKNEGAKALYKGLVPNILNVSHGAIQIIAYEIIREKMKSKMQHKEWTTLHTITACSLSKLIAVATTYPLQNLRMRIQATEGKKLTPIWKEGNKRQIIRCLYRGVTPYMLHVVPNVCVVFMAYELIANRSN